MMVFCHMRTHRQLILLVAFLMVMISEDIRLMLQWQRSLLQGHLNLLAMEAVVEVVMEAVIVEETMEALVQIGILMVEIVLVHTENFPSI